MVTTIILLLDSVRMIWNPFYPQSKRQIGYIFFFVFVTILLVIVQFLDDWETSKSYTLLLIMSYISIAIVVILSIVLECLLRQQGTN